MNFQTRNLYNYLIPGTPKSFLYKKENEEIHLPTLILPEGSVIHRADHEGAKSPSNEIPAFFGDRKSIKIYARGKPEAEAVSSYSVKRPITLFHMTLNTILDISVHPDLTKGDKEALRAYVGEGFVIPIKFLRKENIEKRLYLNRRIANMICRLGFDGWVVNPYDPDKKQGLVQFIISRQDIAEYSPEIMLCTWTNFLERIKTGGKRKNRTRKSRKV